MGRFKDYLLAANLFMMLALAVSMAAAHGGDSQLIHACANANGRLRIVAADALCSDNETPLDWNSRGVQGPQGPPGPQGPSGTPGISGLEIVTQTYRQQAGDTLRTVTATCPSGKKVLAGGHNTTAAMTLYRNSPTMTGDGWSIHADTVDSSTEWGITVYAVCATVAP